MNKNIPYKKQYDQEGVLLNPIIGSYESKLPNRSQRRSDRNQPRFIGNNRGNHLTITEDSMTPKKFKRVIQTISHHISNISTKIYKGIEHKIVTITPNKFIKRIEHYISN